MENHHGLSSPMLCNIFKAFSVRNCMESLQQPLKLVLFITPILYTCEETEALRDQLSCPKTHSSQVAQLGQNQELQGPS